MQTKTKKQTRSNYFRFRNFRVYKDARQLRIELKHLSERFPKIEEYCLKSQLWRALDSILLNIAEGCERYSDVDFSRFLNNSLTSVNEVAACLDAALDDKYVNQEEYKNNNKKLLSIYKQLRAFSAKVRRKR